MAGEEVKALMEHKKLCRMSESKLGELLKSGQIQPYQFGAAIMHKHNNRKK